MVRVTRNNPLLHQNRALESGVASGSASSRARPSTSASPLTFPPGVDVAPLPSRKPAASCILSIDWHQGLDVVRLEGQTLRPNGYHGLEEIKQKTLKIQRIVPELFIVICSYCHSTEYRSSLLAIADSDVAATSQKSGPSGKLAALGSKFPSCSRTLVHIDDNVKVCREVKESIRFQAKQSSTALQFLGAGEGIHRSEQLIFRIIPQ